MFPGVLLVFGMFYRTSVSALCWKNSNGRQVKPSADIYSRRSDVIYRHIWSRLLCSRALTCSEITLLKKEQKLQTLHKINNKWLKCSKRISRPISLSPDAPKHLTDVNCDVMTAGGRNVDDYSSICSDVHYVWFGKNLLFYSNVKRVQYTLLESFIY